MAGANLDSGSGPENSLGAAGLLSRMLVATGGSEPSLSALRFALHLARDARSRVEALTVEDIFLPPGALFAHGDSLAQLMRQAESLAAHRCVKPPEYAGRMTTPAWNLHTSPPCRLNRRESTALGAADEVFRIDTRAVR